MALIAIDAKHKIKRSTIPGVVPVIGTSEDHTDGSWTDNMIYPGEFFFNIPDQKLWIGVAAGVLELYSSVIGYPSLAYADQDIAPGVGERIVRLSGDADTDALGIYNRSGDRVASFAGDGSYFDKQVLMNQTLNVVKSVVMNDTLTVAGYTRITNTLEVNDVWTGGTLTVDSFSTFNDEMVVNAYAQFMADAYVGNTLEVVSNIIGRQQIRANVTNGAPVTLRDLVGSPTTGAIYGFDASYSSTNYRHYYNAGTTATNASTTVTLQTAGLDRLTVAATGIFTRSGLSLSVGKGSAAHSTFEVQGSVADKLAIINTATTLGVNDNTVVCNSANFTVTLPSAVGIQGRKYTIVNNSAFQIQVSEASGQKINGDGIWYLQFDGAFVTVESNGTNWTVVGCKQRDNFSVTVATAGGTYQNNLLLGARSINMIVRNGTITQAPFTFNATTGTVTFTVAVGDRLTVFYTPQ